jgi:hypothetical protein
MTGLNDEANTSTTRLRPNGPETWMSSLPRLALTCILFAPRLPAQEAKTVKTPVVRVVEGGDPTQDYGQCRVMLVGPGVNQPDPYPGYGGFVGWQSPIVLHDGTMLVGFSSGYWHASPPTAYFDANRPEPDEWAKLGLPTDIELRDGSALICIYGRTVGAPHDMVAFCRTTGCSSRQGWMSRRRS